MKITTAMVFAAGFGKRMLPITNATPKPLIKIAGKAIIDYSLELLSSFGVGKIVVNSHHLANQIHGHVNGLKGFVPEIIISHEDEILETGGGLVKALPLLGRDPVLTMNSDVIVQDGEFSLLERMNDAWDPDKMDVLMLLIPTKNAVGYDGRGDFLLADNGQIIKDDSKENPYVFTGVMVIKPEIMRDAPSGSFSIYRDFLHEKYITKDKSLAKVFGIIHDGKWLHIGTPDAIKLAEKHL